MGPVPENTPALGKPGKADTAPRAGWMRRREDDDHAVPIDDVASREPAAFSLLGNLEGAVSPDIAANTYVRVTWRVVSHQYRVSAWQANHPRDHRWYFVVMVDTVGGSSRRSSNSVQALQSLSASHRANYLQPAGAGTGAEL